MAEPKNFLFKTGDESMTTTQPSLIPPPMNPGTHPQEALAPTPVDKFLPYSTLWPDNPRPPNAIDSLNFSTKIEKKLLLE